MKTASVIAIAAVGIAGFLLYRSRQASAESYTPLYTLQETMPQTSELLAASAAVSPRSNYKVAVESFLNTPVNTPESIRAGLNVINTAATEKVQLPRLSSTIQKVAANSNIARLANGSVKVVTVKSVARDSSGMTAIDRIIAKNVAKSKATTKR